MNNNLINGGIYTLENLENDFFIFITENRTLERYVVVRIRFITESSRKYNTKEIQAIINDQINNHKKLEKLCVFYRMNVFHNRCNGFLGVVDADAQKKCNDILDIL